MSTYTTFDPDADRDLPPRLRPKVVDEDVSGDEVEDTRTAAEIKADWKRRDAEKKAAQEQLKRDLAPPTIESLRQPCRLLIDPEDDRPSPSPEKVPRRPRERVRLDDEVEAQVVGTNVAAPQASEVVDKVDLFSFVRGMLKLKQRLPRAGLLAVAKVVNRTYTKGRLKPAEVEALVDRAIAMPDSDAFVEGKAVEAHIRISRRVLNSDAYRSLSPRAKALLLHFYTTCNGNNGRFVMTESQLRRLGWRSRRAIAADKAALIARGFIVETHHGGQADGASRYYLTPLPPNVGRSEITTGAVLVQDAWAAWAAP